MSPLKNFSYQQNNKQTINAFMEHRQETIKLNFEKIKSSKNKSWIMRCIQSCKASNLLASNDFRVIILIKSFNNSLMTWFNLVIRLIRIESCAGSNLYCINLPILSFHIKTIISNSNNCTNCHLLSALKTAVSTDCACTDANVISTVLVISQISILIINIGVCSLISTCSGQKIERIKGSNTSWERRMHSSTESTWKIICPI